MVAQPLTLVWDTSPLYHSALADRLDVLGDLAKGPSGRPSRNVTTAAVDEGLRQLLGSRPDMPWIDIALWVCANAVASNPARRTD